MNSANSTAHADSALPRRSARPGGWIRRLSGAHILAVVVLLLFPLILDVTLHDPAALLRDPDIGWHLANARSLMQTGSLAALRANSFTVAATPWINPEWLSEIPYWVAYRELQLRGIFLVTWLALAGSILAIYWRGFRRSRSVSASFWAAAIAIPLTAVNSGPRTILFGYLALSIELLILDEAERQNRWIVWALPALFALWINLHGSWIIGIALLVLYVVCGSFSLRAGLLEQDRDALRDRLRLWAVLAASFAGLFLNPYGWRLVWNPLDMMLNQRLNIASAAEWRPLDLSSGAGRVALCAILLLLATNLIRPRKWKIYEVAVLVFAWYSAFDHTRFCFLAAVLAMPLLAPDLARGFRGAGAGMRFTPWMQAVGIAGAVLLIALEMPSEKALRAGDAQVVPNRLIESIQPSWRTFNDANLGGALALASKPSFVDTRLDIFEHRGVLQDYLDAIQIRAPLEVLDRWKIDHALLADPSPLAYLLEHTNSWRVLSREGSGEDAYVLLERSSAPAR